MIEVIVENVKDAVKAEELGIHRLELVSAMKEGGLTPSYGTVKRVLENVSIPVQVMIRPHNYGFEYDESEWKTMREDILAFSELGMKGIVFGCLKDGEIDQALLEKVIHDFPDMDITFHRAFDQLRHQGDGLEVLCQYSGHVKRILTSAGKETAFAGIEQLQQLVTLSDVWHGPKILAGAGMTADNFEEMIKVLPDTEFHFGSGVRIDGSFAQTFDVDKVQRILEQWKNKPEKQDEEEYGF